MTTLTNRVVSLYDKKTSMRLTKSEWIILDDICLKERIKRKRLLEIINANKDEQIGLTPAVRLFSLLYCYSLLKEEKNQANDNHLSVVLQEMTR